MWPAFPTSEYYRPLRLPLDHPMPLPGFAGYRPGTLPAVPADRRGRDGSPEFPGRPFARSAPLYAGGFFSARSWNKSAFRGLRPTRTGSAPSCPARRRASLTTLHQGFTRVADRTIDPAPLRTRPLDHARGLHYRGPRRLPGPDSHRQAALNLSPLCHVDLPFFMAPRQSRRTRA
jgi:hypothetical protein